MNPELSVVGLDTRGARPLRVLMIAPTPFFGDRGCHVRIYEEVRSLAQLGVECSVVTYAAGRDLTDVRTVRARTIPGIDGAPMGFSPGRGFLDCSVLLAAHQEIERFRPHLLHAHLHEGVAIGTVLRLRHRLPLIADLQGSLTGELVDQGALREGGVAARLMGVVERWLVRQPDRTLISSGESLPMLRSLGVNPTRVTVLPDGVDVEMFHPESPDLALVARLGLAGKRVVVFLGVLTDYQGVDLLLDVADVLLRAGPNVHFLVLGYPNEERYRAMAQARGLDAGMTFPGRVPYSDAPRWLSVGEVAVSPKRSVTEANGKLLNYMACGLPVVASDTPVNRRLLGDAGVFAPVDDADAFASRIRELLGDRSLAATVGATLRQRAEAKFAWPAIAKRLEVTYREMLVAASRSRRTD